MTSRLHGVAGLSAFAIIMTFWTSTIVSELIGSHEIIRAVKTSIAWGLLLLVPTIAATGASGFRIGGKSKNPTVVAKKRRMPFIAANGILVLVPCALYLRSLAAAGDFGSRFVAVQAIELLAGAINLVLMGLSARDGLRLRNRRFARSRAGASA